VVGTAAAAILAGEGARVTLYEREAIAAGASGRNSGVVQHPFDPPLVELYHRTVEVYRMLGAEAPDAGFVLADAPAGLLLLSRRPDEAVPALAAHLAARFPDLAPRALGDADLRALEPTLAPGLGACRIEAGFPVVPSAPTYALASLAERRGAVLRLGRSAAPAVESGRCVGVRVGGSNQVEPAGAVLVTAGPWSALVIDPSGTWQPIRQVWGVVAETIMASPPRHVLEEAEMDEALGIGARGFTGDAPAPAAPTADAENGPRFSLMTAAGRSVAGSTFLEGDQPELRPWVERILRHGAEFVPALADAPIREVRACARPVALDGRPLIGAVPGIEHLYLCAGHGPWGISTGPGSAQLLADVVLGRPAQINPAFDPGRFGPVTTD